MFELSIFLVVLLFVLIVANVISLRQSRGIRQFLKDVATPVGKDYFDPFAEKAGDLIQYGDHQFSGFSNVSNEGIYLESVFKFYVVIPWTAISAIRVKKIEGKAFANLRIRRNGEIDRKLLVSWNPSFDRYIPDTVTIVRD